MEVWITEHVHNNFWILTTPAEDNQAEASKEVVIVNVEEDKVKVKEDRLEEGGEELLTSPEKRVLVLAQVYASCLEDQVFV